MATKASAAFLVVIVCAACGGGDAAAARPVDAFPSEPGHPWIPNIATPVQGPVLLAPGEPEAMSFEPVVAHDYFPLDAGVVREYEGESDGQHRRDVVSTLPETRVLEGVACTAVHQEVYLDGILSEITTEWFAQDGQGNVWKFGEESRELADDRFERTADSWVAGTDGARPWLFLSASPEVGDLYAGNAAEHEDRLLVVALGVTAEVPAGVFVNCLQLHENPDDPEDADIILLGPGAGLVSEVNRGGAIELVRLGAR